VAVARPPRAAATRSARARGGASERALALRRLADLKARRRGGRELEPPQIPTAPAWGHRRATRSSNSSSLRAPLRPESSSEAAALSPSALPCLQSSSASRLAPNRRRESRAWRGTGEWRRGWRQRPRGRDREERAASRGGALPPASAQTGTEANSVCPRPACPQATAPSPPVTVRARGSCLGDKNKVSFQRHPWAIKKSHSRIYILTILHNKPRKYHHLEIQHVTYSWSLFAADSRENCAPVPMFQQ
jgi:hypothetical protein